MVAATRNQPIAFDENLVAQIRSVLARKKGVVEKMLFGCICFLINGNVLAGVWKKLLIVRIGPDESEAALLEPHVGKLNITGRPEKGGSRL